MFSKKVLSVAFAAALTLSAAMPAFASTQFKDVNDAKLDDGYNTAINFLSGVGIVSGDNNGNFNPNDNVKRSEVAKIIDNTLGYGKLASASKPSTTKFSDVTKDQWYAGYVNVATQKGLVKGVSDTKFAPDDNVTYAQYLTIALRALGYTDDDLTGTWPLNYVTKAVELGLLDGLDNVDPNEKATRKDIAVITYNTLYTVTKDDTYNTNSEVLKPWLIDHVSSALGVAKVTGYVVGDKTTDATLADTVKVATDYKNSVGNTVSSPANDTTTFSFSVSDEQKAKFGLGAKVTFYATTNYNNNKKIVYVENAKRDILTVTPTRSIGSLDTVSGNTYFNYQVSGTDTKAVVNSGAYTIINGKHASTDDIYKVKGSDSADTTLTLVNNDDDAKYDFVIASTVSKPVIVAHDVLGTDTAIKITGSSTDLSLQYPDSATGLTTNATVKVTGAASSLGDIKRGDVIYVTEPTDGSVVNIEVVRNAFTGKITATTVDSGKITGLTVSGAVYTFLDSNKPLATDTNYAVGSTVDLTVGKNNVIVKSAASSGALDLSNYGVLLAKGYTAASTDKYGVSTDAVYNVKFTKLDGNGTTSDLKVTQAVYNTLSTPSVVKVSTDSNGYSTFTGDTNVAVSYVPASSYSAAQKVANTKLYVTNAGVAGVALSDQKSYLSDFASVAVPSTGNLYLITKIGGLNDYAAVVIVGNTTTAVAQDSTAFGYIKSFNGGAYVGTQAVKVYTALVNGVATTLNVKDDSSIVIPTYFTSVVKDSNNVVTAFNAPVEGTTLFSNKTVSGADSTRIAVAGKTFTIDANTKVYDKDNNLKTVGDLTFRTDNAELVNVDVVVTTDNKAAIIKMLN